MHKKIVLTKNPLNFYLLKVKSLNGDSVKYESPRKKDYGGAGRQTPPPRLFRVKPLREKDLKRFFNTL